MTTQDIIDILTTLDAVKELEGTLIDHYSDNEKTTCVGTVTVTVPSYTANEVPDLTGGGE